MKELIKNFKKEVISLSSHRNFIHHKWYVKYHLEIVEKISLELCDIYTNADRDLVALMVWLHDYGKIVDFENQYSSTLITGKAKLLGLGFSENITNKAIEYIEILDKKDELSSDSTPIELKIVSSADGSAHLVGPFFYLYWYENSNKPFEKLMGDNINKINIDWEKKIVLPEAKRAFIQRYNFFLEQFGNIPNKLL